MSEQAFYISGLVQKKLKGELSASDELELNAWLQVQENKKVFEELNDVEWVKVELEKFHRYNEAAVKETIEKALQKAKIIKLNLWSKVAVAASVIILLGVGGYWLWNKQPGPDSQGAAVVKTTDVPAPGETKAVITLADGSRIFLESANAGELAVQGEVKVVKLADGRVVYESLAGTPQSTVQYNTLSNPRGSKVIDMMLADGSRVWLNSESSIRYPVAFSGKERMVEISGEVYFEVTHNASKPFIVKKGDVRVTVLGTHFNVNAYYDEEAMKVTLLQGSVRVSNSKGAAIIKPGQQATIPSPVGGYGEGPQTSNNIDLDEVIAWKNGIFQFNNSDLKTVMRQIARWYDVEVEYQDDIPEKYFKGEIDRNVSASKVLQILEYAGVHFKIEGKKIVVTPS